MLINLITLEFSTIKTLNVTLEYISIFFSITIIILVWKYAYTYQKKKPTNSIDKREIRIQSLWLQKTLIFGLLLCIIWFLSINFFRQFMGDGYARFYPLWIGMSVLIYWMAYTAIFQRKIFQERLLLRNELDISIPNNQKISGTDKHKNKELLNEIFTWIQDQKVYLNPELQLEDVAKKFNKSKGYISQLISANHELNFTDYINKLRIDESKKILGDPTYSKYTIVAIGLESGFNSKSSFYTAFKKHTGKTPLQYKRSPE